MTRLVLTAIAVAVLTVVAGCGDSGPPEKQLTEEELAIQRLRSVFQGAGCGQCHVAGPELEVKPAPDLTYYAQKPQAGRGAAFHGLTPGNGRGGCVTVPDAAQRGKLADFLGVACKLSGYYRPKGREHPTCPVTGLKVDARKPGARRTHAGKTYYFPDENSAKKFDLNPAHFAK